MTQDPRGVIRIQSPCRHTPGKSAKYESCKRVPSSPQKNTGIEGIGAVTTSSPTSSVNDSPVRENASTRAPNARQEISPFQTGTVGAAPTSAVQMSVPPDSDAIWISCLLYTSPSPRDGLLTRMPSS